MKPAIVKIVNEKKIHKEKLAGKENKHFHFRRNKSGK